jgi:hypothetical protein
MSHATSLSVLLCQVVFQTLHAQPARRQHKLSNNTASQCFTFRPCLRFVVASCQFVRVRTRQRTKHNECYDSNSFKFLFTEVKRLPELQAQPARRQHKLGNNTAPQCFTLQPCLCFVVGIVSNHQSLHQPTKRLPTDLSKNSPKTTTTVQLLVCNHVAASEIRSHP